jgi:hypothetical protein
MLLTGFFFSHLRVAFLERKGPQLSECSYCCFCSFLCDAQREAEYKGRGRAFIFHKTKNGKDDFTRDRKANM